MPRHPEQDAALTLHYKKCKDDTRDAFVDAMDRLIQGRPLLHTDGKLTEANLYREAQRSRATLNRYPDIKDQFKEAKRHPDKDAPSNPAEKIQELEETIRELRRGENKTINELKSSRDCSAQEIYILNRIIDKLKEQIEQLKKRLREIDEDGALHLVPST